MGSPAIIPPIVFLTAGYRFYFCLHQLHVVCDIFPVGLRTTTPSTVSHPKVPSPIVQAKFASSDYITSPREYSSYASPSLPHPPEVVLTSTVFLFVRVRRYRALLV